MKALISTFEKVESGYRVAQISEKEFDVSESCFWIDCADTDIADQCWYDPATQTIKYFPQDITGE